MAYRAEMEVSPSASAVTVAPLGADEQVWQQFLVGSANATLFHDLDFLRYHPADRFRFHHLVFRQNGKPVAVLPGGLSNAGERPMYCSPLGASVGGPAVAGAHLRADLAVTLIEVLQDYAREQGWGGIEITLPPDCYHPNTAELIAFALFYCGFHLAHRWLCHIIPIGDGSPSSYESIFRQNQVSCVRAAHRRSVVGIETGVDGLDDFLKLFRETYDRHGVAATHSPEEITDLLQRMPDRVRIHLAMLGDVPIAGLLVFRLSVTVANTFYICNSTEHAGEHGVAFVIADLLARLGRSGVRHLDLGPSASDINFNKGVAFFKEGLGAYGQCRDRWRWNCVQA